MNRSILLLSLLSLWLCLPHVACCEEADTLRLIHRVGVDFRPSRIVQDDPFFEGENQLGRPMRFGYSCHLKYSFQFADNSRMGTLYPHTYQGIGLSYNDLGNRKEIGSPVAVYAFQGSRIAILSSALSLDYEWNFGASFGWKKSDGISNPNNTVVGSKVNAYINLGFLLNWQVAPRWNLTAGVDLTHYSNGNTDYPNLGVNMVGGRVGLVYSLHPEGSMRRAASSSCDMVFKPYVSYDVVVYGAGRKRAFITDDECLFHDSWHIWHRGHELHADVQLQPLFPCRSFARCAIRRECQRGGLLCGWRSGCSQVLSPLVSRAVCRRSIRPWRAGDALLCRQRRPWLQRLAKGGGHEGVVSGTGPQDLDHTPALPPCGLSVESIQRPQQLDAGPGMALWRIALKMG